MRFSTVLLMTYVRGFVVETNGFSVLSPAYLRRHQLVLPRALMTRASAIQTAAPQRVAAAPSDTSLPFKKHASLPLTEKVEVNVYVDNFIVDSLQLKKNQRKGSFLCTLDSLQDAKSIRSVINTRRPFLVDKTYNFFLNVPGTQLRPLKLERAASEVVSRLESAPRKVLQVFVEPKPQQVLTSGDMARPELAHMPDPSDTESYSMVSFFKFTDISDPDAAIQSLFELWRPFKALGRVYVAKEGVNAQMAVASNVLRYFKKSLMQSPYLLGVFCNVDRELSADDFERLLPFHSLHIRRRHQVLADGGALAHLRLDIGTGQEMNPLEWHSKLDQPEAIVLDCRNKFESEVGRFDRAIPLNTTTFRESWGVLSSLLKGRSKDTPIMTYCTGGIRCVKVNAFIEQELGFKNVSRLKGGIINYVQQLRKLDESINKKGDRTENASSPTDSEGIVPNSKFRGMNYVFDERVCARITDDVMALCESCGTPWDMYANCNNAACDVSPNER
jgi:predicted sulfurtransferase